MNLFSGSDLVTIVQSTTTYRKDYSLPYRSAGRFPKELQKTQGAVCRQSTAPTGIDPQHR